MKAQVDTLIRIAVPMGTAVAHAPWWVFTGVFVLLLAHRVLPWESKDLLTLWLRVVPDRRGEVGEHRRSRARKNEHNQDQDG